MHKNIKPFGIHINVASIGEAWIDLVNAILQEGVETLDEERSRLCLQNVRIRIKNIELPDSIIEKYGDKEKIDGIVYLTFKGEEMYDFDIIPSFSPGAKSYYARLKEGRMDEYVVKRLSQIPESKKGIISFIHWYDYKAVLDTPFDDYLPCITTIQFRLLENEKNYKMNIIFTARSLDAFQKGNGNIIAIAMLAQKIQKQLNRKLEKNVIINALDGFIADAHIYGECLGDAKNIISKVKNEN